MGKRSSARSYLETLQWAILPDALADILARAEDNMEAFFDVGDSSKTPFTRSGNTAIIDVKGVLFKRSNILTMLGIGTSIENMSAQFDLAMNDDSIKEILLAVDSPGGEVSGTNAFAEKIYQARGKKPIKSRVDGMMASAAYWIASASDSIEATDEVNMIGSIGVVATVYSNDPDERIFVSSNAPNKVPDPDTKEGQSVWKARVNKLEAIFIEKVARNRGVEENYVKASYGRGDVLLAKEALEAGMIDSLTNYNGGNMDKKELKERHTALYEDIVAEVTAPLTAQVTALQGEITELKASAEALQAQIPKKVELSPEIQAQLDDIKMTNATLEKQVLEAKLTGVLDEVKTDLMALHGKLGVDEIVAIGARFSSMQETIAKLGGAKGSDETDTDKSALVTAEVDRLVAAGMDRTSAYTKAYQKFN
jgi:ClpP class serine protease